MLKEMNRISETSRRELKAREKMFQNKIIENLKCND